MFFIPSVNDSNLCLLQTDTGGFYNQVEHERILQSIDFAVQRYIVPTWSTLESLWQAQRKEYYEFSEDSGVRRLKMYRSLRVGDIVPNL